MGDKLTHDINSHIHGKKTHGRGPPPPCLAHLGEAADSGAAISRCRPRIPREVHIAYGSWCNRLRVVVGGGARRAARRRAMALQDWLIGRGTSRDVPGCRGLHSLTSQLNLSRVCHKKTPYTP